MLTIGSSIGARRKRHEIACDGDDYTRDSAAVSSSSSSMTTATAKSVVTPRTTSPVSDTVSESFYKGRNKLSPQHMSRVGGVAVPTVILAAMEIGFYNACGTLLQTEGIAVRMYPSMYVGYTFLVCM